MHFYFSLGASSLLDPISLYLGMLGRGALLSLGWAAIWSDSENKKRLYEMWFLPTANRVIRAGNNSCPQLHHLEQIAGIRLLSLHG